MFKEMVQDIKEKFFYENPLGKEMTEGQVYDADVGDIVLVKGCLQVWAKTSTRRWTQINNDYEDDYSFLFPGIGDIIGEKVSPEKLFELKPYKPKRYIRRMLEGKV